MSAITSPISHRVNRAAALTLTTLLVITAGLAQAAVFTTPGQFSVSPNGSASYSIPLQVPSGTAGMAPTLSLNYDSQGGNGILGMGWGLSGLSQITRCPRTLAQDGVRGGINYDANDKLCLDGQRLIATTGTYGADQTEYRTELANFAKIVSYGTAGNGPAWFKVWTKGGQIIEYGNSADSRIEAQGKTAARLWGVNKISDTKGNYMTVSYVEDNANGEAYVSRIDYTGNTTSTSVLTPYASVQFVYETRPDSSTAYQAGSVIKSLHRITNIKTYIGITLIKNYRITYQLSAPSSRSEITALTECDEISNCLQPIRFNWQNDNNLFSSPQQWVAGYGAPGWANNTQYPRMLADVNGDGLADIVGFSSSGVMVSLSTGTSFTAPQQWIADYGTSGGWSDVAKYPRMLADVNGDGLADIVGFAGAGVGVSLSTGSGFAPRQQWVAGYGAPGWANNTQYPRMLADVNGDGLADIVGFSSSGVMVSLSTGTSFTAPQQWIAGYGTAGGWSDVSKYPRMLEDVNGDGLADIVGFAGSGVSVSLSTGSGFAPGQQWVAGYGAPGWANNTQYPRMLADVNGDGLADIVGFSSSAVMVSLSTGTSFTAAQQWIADYGTSGGWSDMDHYPRELVDVSGDGLADIVGFSSSDVGVSLSTGSGFATRQQWVAGYGTAGGWSSDDLYPRMLTDVNGDGLADVTGFAGSGVSISTRNILFPDLLASISTSLNVVTSITYKPLTNSTVYTKDSGSNAATYPVQDVQAPMYVVSSVTSSDGLGGNVVTNYSYGGAKADFNGRGFLGFRWMKSSSPDTGLAVTTFTRQDYPYIGLPSQVEKRKTSDNTLLSAASSTYASQVLGGTRYFPYVAQTLENNYELSGSLVTSTTTSYQYDAYGNATQVTVNSNDGYVKTTTNTYQNDTTNWYLGRLLRSSVSSTAP